MDDIKDQDTPDGVSKDEKGLDNKGYDERNLIELDDRRKLLTSENETYKSRINKLQAEIDEAETAISSGKEYITSCERRISEYPSKINNQKSRNESLLAELNTIKLKVKSLKGDEESTLLLRKSLMGEHENLKNEKDVLIDRINKLEKAIGEISSEREWKLPKLKEYDERLKEAWNVFHEAESRMEVSLKLHQGRIASKSEHS